MKSHPVYGVSVLERGWVPAPSYLLRRQRVLNMLSTLTPGSLLEIGCGAGALLNDLSGKGFSCVGVETSEAAYDLATYVNRACSDVYLHPNEKDDWINKFDYVLALEVLEHIENDKKALRTWSSYLKRQTGKLLLSVPAHQRRWSASDVWAGHFRRYEHDEIEHLLNEVGLQIERIECYGFPLANLIEPIRAHYHGKRLRAVESIDESEQRLRGNAQSGISRDLESRIYPLQSSWIGTKLMQAFFLLQGLSVKTHLGTGYLVMATRQ